MPCDDIRDDGARQRFFAKSDPTTLVSVAYFERIWAGAPDEVAPEHFALRREFLLAGARAGERVLDLGCGDGAFAQALAEHGADPVGADVALEALRRARLRAPQLEFRHSGEVLPFGDGEFAVVWAGELFEHVQDGLGLLAEVTRVLRPGGRLLLSTPDHGWWRRLSVALSRRRFEAQFEPRSDHVRFFTAHSLRTFLAAAGFDEPDVRSHRGVLLASATRR
jgi:2-polyprenyl-6-hydroxyphenyl methylase/3-demethylubiquinone-9 3-methyltransferase